jgi:hypothetical protein
MPASTVAQLTPYTCALACLESFFNDAREPFSQTEMLQKYYPILRIADDKHKHEYGAINDEQIIALCKTRGISVTPQDVSSQLKVDYIFSEALDSKCGILIFAFWNKQNYHCVRVTDVKSSGLYEVMCSYFYPPSATLLDVTFADLSSWSFRALILS